MVKRFLLGLVLSAALAFCIPAFSQAAAESALTNALSSSATVKAGSALNRALNQGSNQLGARIQERTSSPLQVGVKRKTSSAQLRTSAGGSRAGGNVRTGSSAVPGTMSIQGGEAACASASPSQTSLDKTNPGTAPIDCRGQKPASKSGTVEDKYKPFVTLSFPK